MIYLRSKGSNEVWLVKIVARALGSNATLCLKSTVNNTEREFSVEVVDDRFLYCVIAFDVEGALTAGSYEYVVADEAGVVACGTAEVIVVVEQKEYDKVIEYEQFER